jgi:hypothetical protein
LADQYRERRTLLSTHFSEEVASFALLVAAAHPSATKTRMNQKAAAEVTVQLTTTTTS